MKDLDHIMPSFNAADNNFLPSLQNYLDTSLRGNYAPLSSLPAQIDALCEAGQQPTAEAALQLLGTAVAKDREWQVPYREAGLLNLSIEKLEDKSTPPELAKQYLRITGNSVADNDRNREFILDGFRDFGNILLHFEDDQCVTTVLGVLLNLSNDYDPAQVKCAELRVDMMCARDLARNRISEEFTVVAADLIMWTTGKLTQAQLEDDTSVQVFSHIVQVALHSEDAFQEYVGIIIHYLQSPQFQARVAKPDIFEGLMRVLFSCELVFDPHEYDQVFKVLETKLETIQENSDNLNVLLTVQLINAISSMSSTDAFVNNITLDIPIMSKVFSIIKSSEELPPSTVCTCVILGNLASNDAVSEALVHTHRLHDYLINRILPDTRKRPALLYAAAALLRHLAFPLQNRSQLASGCNIQAYCGLLDEAQDAAVRGEGAAILGKLMSDNLGTVELVIRGRTPNTMKLPHDYDTATSQYPRFIDYIVAQALAPAKPVTSMSMKTAPIELARALVNMMRTMSQATMGITEKRDLWDAFLKTSHIARPIARLVRQRFFAGPRSEGLLGLGLMAQVLEGASRVLAEIQADGGVLTAVKELASSREGDQQIASQGLRRDQQNALVLLHALLKHDQLQGDMRTKIEAMAKELGQDTSND